MLTLKFVKIEEHNRYLLEDENKNKYSLVLEFYGLDKPKIDDVITLDNRLLDKNFEGYAQPYAFEIIKSKNDYDEKRKIDYAILTINGKQLPIRRIYG